MSRTLALAHKETLHMLRDPQFIYLALGLPLVLVLLFGYAVSFDVEDVRVGVMDLDRSPSSRSFIQKIDATVSFDVDAMFDRSEQIERAFRSSRQKAVFVIPKGYHRARLRDQAASIQLLVDGSDGTSAQVILGEVQALAQAETIAALQVMRTALPIEPRVRTWFNPNMQSALFVVPGLVAIVLAILSVLLSALSVAREWERGSMEQLLATPVARGSVVAGKVLPYVALGIMQFLLVLTAGAYFFDVPMRGSFPLLLAAVCLFLTCVIGQGLFISMATRNQQVATQLAAVSAILPSLLLSGFLFPIENMPLPLRAISHIVPARYLIVCLRGVLLQGRGFTELWPQFIGLGVLAMALIALTTARFQRRLV